MSRRFPRNRLPRLVQCHSQPRDHPRPLALTDDQLQIVLTYAASVPVHWRERFLQAIADRLLPLDRIENHDVQTAVVSTLDRMGLAA